MRTKLLFLYCLLFAVPLLADPPARSVAEKLGFSEEILKQVPDKHFPRAPNPDYKPATTVVEQRSIDPNLLAPRFTQRPEPAQLLPYLIELHQKNPKSPKITRKLALTYLKAGRPQDALYWFVQTWFLDRNDLPSLWNCAVLSYRLGDYRSVSKYLKEYAQRDPHSVWGRIAREMVDASPFSGTPELNAWFARRLPRGGVMTQGTPTASGPSLMVIGGREMEIPQQTISFSDRFTEEPNKKLATNRKDNSMPRAEPLPSKVSLRHAVIDNPVEPPSQQLPTSIPAPKPSTGVTSTSTGATAVAQSPNTNTPSATPAASPSAAPSTQALPSSSPSATSKVVPSVGSAAQPPSNTSQIQSTTAGALTASGPTKP